MQAVNTFIKSLGKNYYTDLITDINSETIDFELYFVLVKYQNKEYFELNNNEISHKWKETLNKIKETYFEALTEIYTLLLSNDSSKASAFLDFNTDAIKLHLTTLRNDFYIDDSKSRYYSIVEDNPELLDLENIYNGKKRNSEVVISEDIVKLFDTSKQQNSESIYFLKYLYERNIVLSLIPFSLFILGQQFIIQLDKIKLKITPVTIGEETNSQKESTSKTTIEETYFESFLKLIDNPLILKKYTAIGIMIDCKIFIKEIKSEILETLQIKGENRNDYLDYLINEIEKQHYVKNADISYIQKWLDEYKISIHEIFMMKIINNPIEALIDRHYMDMDKYSKEKDKALLLQSDFRDFFCKYYADELITFIKSKKKNNVIESEVYADSLLYPKNQYLKSFVDELNNDKDLYDSTFMQCYDFGILHFAEYLKAEINENILNLPEEKIKSYLDLVKNKLISTHYYHTQENSLDKWITSYHLQDFEFPFLENEKVKSMLKSSINYHLWDDKFRSLLEDIQLDFFYYASMIEAKKIMTFIAGLNIHAPVEIKNGKQKIQIDSVFKSDEAFELFNILIEKFDITLINIKKRGVQAQLNAIWGCPKSRKEIFKEHAELKEYVDYLNRTYLTSFQSRTMSDGSKYHNSIKEWLN